MLVLLALPLPLLLAGCQGRPESSLQPPAALPPLPRSAVEAGAVAGGPAATGLTPLPTPQQVVTAQPVGRLDPFLPVQGAASGPGGAAQATLPAGFRFQGVILSRGRAQALVQFGSESGNLRVGDAGGRTTPLLPPGWAVGGIDVARGRLILRVSGRSVPVSLDAQS